MASIISAGDFAGISDNGMQFLLDLQKQVDQLRTHTHTENTAASYTQNATTAAASGINTSDPILDNSGTANV